MPAQDVRVVVGGQREPAARTLRIPRLAAARATPEVVGERPAEGPSPRPVLAAVLRVLAAGQTRSGPSGRYVNAAIDREERPAL